MIHHHIAVPLFSLLLALPAGAQETWCGLEVAPENRCAPYHKSTDYPYPQSVEDDIIASYGGCIFSPYTGEVFAHKGQSDIEHIVAVSEAHDSGLCAASRAMRRRFACDLLNLTLAAPGLNRHEKRGLDAGEWIPEKNTRWFAWRVIAVKRKYGLAVDAREAAALARLTDNCTGQDLSASLPLPARSGGLDAAGCHAGSQPCHCHRPRRSKGSGGGFADRNCADFGTWKEAQDFFEASGPGDPHRLDGDNDGIACEALR